MADDKREKRGLMAKWRERRAHRSEGAAEPAERLAQEAEERARSARVEQDHDAARGTHRGQGAGL